MIKKIKQLWQNLQEWIVVRQSAKFAEELITKNYEPRKPWNNGVWKNK